MADIDPATVEAKKAYCENGHCRLNNLICNDGDAVATLKFILTEI